MIRKILAVVLLIVGVSGISLSVVGVIVSQDLIDSLGEGINQSLSLTIDSLDTVGETLVLTRSLIVTVSDGLETMSDTADNVSTTIYESEPLLGQITDVVVQDVPDSIVAIEEAIPNVALAAGAVDDTLVLLDRFQIDQRVLGVPIRFDLGIEYDPSLPLDDTVSELGASLEGLPEELRELESSLLVTKENLVIIGDNVHLIASDLEAVNESMAEVTPLLEDYIRLTTETTDLIRQTRSSLTAQLEAARIVATVLFVWIGLNQIVPLYMAAALFRSDSAPRGLVPVVEGAGEEE